MLLSVENFMASREFFLSVENFLARPRIFFVSRELFCRTRIFFVGLYAGHAAGVFAPNFITWYSEAH